MADNPANNDDALDEQLVAYLDGELSVDASRQMEAQLAQDPALRARLQKLERAWGMLDSLTKPEMTANFTQSTMAMVAVAAREDLAVTQAAMPQVRRRHWAIAAGGFLLAALAGVLVVGLLLPNPNKELLHDLPALVELDHYYHKDGQQHHFEDIGFLRQLRDDGLFPGTPQDNIPDQLPVDEMSRRQRERFVRELNREEKLELANKQRRFAEFDHAQKLEIWAMHEQLCADDELRDVMVRYHRWLLNLPGPKRTEVLNQQDPAARIELVSKMLGKHRQPGPPLHINPPVGDQRLTPEDFEGMMEWMLVYIRARDPNFDDRIQHIEHQFSEMPRRAQRRAIFYLVCQHLATFKPGELRLDPRQFEQLRSHLTEPTQRRLEQMPERQRHDTLMKWIDDARHKIGGRGVLEFFFGISDAELDEFLEALPPAERQRFERMDPTQRKTELRRHYLTRIRERVEDIPIRPPIRPGFRPRGPGGPGPGILRPRDPFDLAPPKPIPNPANPTPRPPPGDQHFPKPKHMLKPQNFGHNPPNP